MKRPGPGFRDRNEAVREFWAFLRMRKKWWLAPLLLFLIAFGAVVVVSQTSLVAPFIYSLF